MLLTANFKGNNIDNLDGEIKLLNSNFVKYNNNLELYDFSIRTYKETNIPVLSLRTDFVNADIKGFYNFAALGGLIRSTLAKLMPSQFPVPANETAEEMASPFPKVDSPGGSQAVGLVPTSISRMLFSVASRLLPWRTM